MSANRIVTSEASVQRLLETLKDKQIVIYGGGKVGTRVCRSLQSYGIRPVAFWDIRSSVIKQIDGIEVVNPAPETVSGNPNVVVLVTVFSENVCRSIATDLKSRGAVNVIYKRALINSMLYLECHRQVTDGTFRFELEKCHLCPVSKEMHNRCDIYSENLAMRVRRVDGATHGPASDTFVIPSMGVLVTNHCNLTCKGCNHLRDLYKPADNVRLEPDRILSDLRRILDVVDLIERLVIVGGEAFVHSGLEEITERILALPRIGSILIITNGTIIPKNDRLFRLLSDKRVMVEISGYGDFLPQPLRDNVQRFISVLVQHGIAHRHLETLEWQDFGDFHHRGYDRKQHLAVYKTCCFVSNDLFDGKLFKCSRSVFATRLGKIPDYPGDYVDVRNTSPEQLRQKLVAFLENRFPEVCQHCNGTSENRTPAGIQVPKSGSQTTATRHSALVELGGLISSASESSHR